MDKKNIELSKKKSQKNKIGFILIQSITLFRIVLSIIFAGFLLTCSNVESCFIISLSILILIEATDLLDGPIARQYNLSSEYGATLDPYADSISRIIVYSSMALSGLVLLLLPLCMALRDITVA